MVYWFATDKQASDGFDQLRRVTGWWIIVAMHVHHDHVCDHGHGIDVQRSRKTSLEPAAGALDWFS